MSEETNIYKLAFSGEKVDSILASVNTDMPNIQTKLTTIESTLEQTAVRKVVAAVIPASNQWDTENKIYTYTLSLSGVTENTAPHIVLSGLTAQNYNEKITAWNCITSATAFDDKIVFYCYNDPPQASFEVQIEYFI